MNAPSNPPASMAASPLTPGSTPPELSPRLAPPGAGVPFIERWVGGMMLKRRRRRGTVASLAADFARERTRIMELTSALDDRSASRRVLIRRLPGLEDSSRYWSVWMTLDHLRIVNLEIARVIDALSRGVRPEGEASTAAVKPSESVDGRVVEAFEQSCDHLAQSVSRSTNLLTRERFAHPWFGPLDALGWHAMSGMHMGIHRGQIERIMRGLGVAPSRG